MKKDVEWLKKRELIANIKSLAREVSQEWPHQEMVELRDVLKEIDQLEEPEILSWDWIDEHKVYYYHDWSSVVPTEDLQNLLVPKHELPVVPTWFDEWWRDVAKGGGVLFHNMQRFHNELYISGTRETCDYIGVPDNKKKLLNIIINELDYEVEEEPLYYALVKGHELIDDDFKYFNLDVLNNVLFVGSRRFTEKSKSEWNEIGINDSNADFVKAEEVEE